MAMNKARNKEQLDNIQHLLQEINAAFFTGGGISILSKTIYPYNTRYSKHTEQCLHAMLQEEIKHNISSTDNGLSPDITLSPYITSTEMLAKAIARGYSFFNSLSNREKKKKKQITIPELQLYEYHADHKAYKAVLKRLLSIGKKIKEKGLGTLILFGSLATQDYIPGHSDLDLVLIISKEASLDQKKLEQIRKEVAVLMKESYFIDPLQHHGPYILSEFDLGYYHQHFLPFAVFENAVSLSGETKLVFYERDAPDEAFSLLQKYKHLFQNIVRKKEYHLPRDAYAQKYLFQVILLFPSVYLLARGEPCYKRESFKNIKQYLNNQGNELLHCLSEIRSKNAFKTKPASLVIQKVFRMIPYPFIYPVLYRILLTKISKHEQKKIQNILQSGLKSMIVSIEELESHEKNI